MHIRSWLALGFMFAQACVSAQTATVQPALSLDDARAQRARSKLLKAEAEKAFEAEKAACQNKVIAINCLSSAKERHTEAVKVADAMQREAHQAEREAHRLDAEAKAAKRQAEAPAREARQKADIETYRDKETQRAAERERISAEEPAKLDSRRRKLAAEQAARQKKLVERQQEDTKLAAKAPENAKKRAERERQHAERVKKIDERARDYAELLKRREVEDAARQAGASGGSPAK